MIGSKIGGRILAWRRTFAVLAACGFLLGAVADGRHCPHHEPVPGSLVAQHSDLDGHNESGDASDIPECSCVDICAVDGPSVLPMERGVVGPIGIVDATSAPSPRVAHPRPTAFLIPDANAPPHVA
jgi:hypothetical protein